MPSAMNCCVDSNNNESLEAEVNTQGRATVLSLMNGAISRIVTVVTVVEVVKEAIVEAAVIAMEMAVITEGGVTQDGVQIVNVSREF